MIEAGNNQCKGLSMERQIHRAALHLIRFKTWMQS